MSDAAPGGAHSAVRSVLIPAALAASSYLLLDELATVFVVVFSAVLLSIALSAGPRLFEARGALPHKVALDPRGRRALPLAVLAGLLDFIPYVGPTIALIPAAIVALLVSPQSALYVVLLYLVVQIIESYVAQPLIEARAVSLPPALILLSQLICSVWLGAIGLLIATPLLLTVVIAIQVFHQQGALGQSRKLAGL